MILPWIPEIVTGALFLGALAWLAWKARARRRMPSWPVVRDCLCGTTAMFELGAGQETFTYQCEGCASVVVHHR